MSPPHKDVIAEALPRAAPKSLSSSPLGSLGFPNQEQVSNFSAKTQLTNSHSSPPGPVFAWKPHAIFIRKKKSTQHETKERSKISLTHCQATVPFPTTPCSFFKHKDVCHMVNESIWKSVNRPCMVPGSLGAVRFPCSLQWSGSLCPSP